MQTLEKRRPCLCNPRTGHFLHGELATSDTGQAAAFEAYKMARPDFIYVALREAEKHAK